MTDREIMQQALEALTTYDGTNGEGKRKRVLATLRERLAQPEQAPVAWLYRDAWGTMKLSQVTPPPVGAFPVYTAPPQRKPLTDEEISDLWCKVSNTDFVTADTHVFARAIEAAHGIKENT